MSAGLTQNEMKRLNDMIIYFEAKGLGVRVAFNVFGNDEVEICDKDGNTIASGDGLILDDAITDVIKSLQKVGYF